jgi:hypothetical protein
MERKLLLDAKIAINYPVENLKKNIISASKKNYIWLQQEDFSNGRDILIIAGSPSVSKYIDEIKEKQKAGSYVMALNGANDYLVDRGIIPDCFAMMDARPLNYKLVKKPQKETLFLLASQVHQKVFEHLKEYPIILWHGEADYFPFEEVNKLAIKKGLHSYPMLGGGQTVGTRAICIATTLGFKNIFIYGFDSSYDKDKHHAYEQKQNDTQRTIKLEINGEEFITTPILARQVDTYLQMKNLLKKQDVKITLRSEGYALAVQNFVEKTKELNDTVEKKETHKYNQMWNIDNYRKVAPGEFMVENAIEKLGLTTDDKIIDFGVGTGRGAKKFQDKGFSITGVDLSINCLDKDVNVPLCIASLWNLPENLTCDYGYCTDVMEHIPTDKVEDVILGISKACKKGVYFQICLTEDHMGAYIDDHLHLTVKPSEWWVDILSKYFTIKGMHEENNNLNIWVVK